jgi:nitrate reductase NapAB chaperone NapD
MPTSGLVLVLSDGADADAALGALRGDDRFTIGERAAAGRVPVVLETRSERDGRDAIAWLERLPGVLMVEVAFVDFGDTLPQREEHTDR